MRLCVCLFVFLQHFLENNHLQSSNPSSSAIVIYSEYLSLPSSPRQKNLEPLRQENGFVWFGNSSSLESNGKNTAFHAIKCTSGKHLWGWPPEEENTDRPTLFSKCVYTLSYVINMTVAVEGYSSQTWPSLLHSFFAQYCLLVIT